MNLLAAVRWLFALASPRDLRQHGDDPADMGTAFGLDATTTLEVESLGDARQPEGATSRFEHRLHRRTSL